MVFSVMIAWLPALTAVSLATCDLADHFHYAIGGFRDRGRGAGQHRPRGRLGIEWVVLAMQVPDASIRAVDLDHPITLVAQERGQPGTVGSGAFDAEADLLAVLVSPPVQLLLPGPIHRDCDLAEPGSELV